MGDLSELWEKRYPELYGPLLHINHRSESIFQLLAQTQADLDDIGVLLADGWRENLVGAVAALFHPDREACRRLLWGAFDRGSWVAPQLAVCALMLDAGDFAEARRRLLLRCPVNHEHLDGTDPQWRHVVHGTSALEDHNMKAMAALLATHARCQAGRDWLGRHLPVADAFWALEIDVWDHGDQIARSWGDGARQILQRLSYPVPEWLAGDVPDPLMKIWDCRDQSPAVRLLCSGEWMARIYRLFGSLMQNGHRSFILEGDQRQARILGRELDGNNQLLLELSGPYLIPGMWQHLTNKLGRSGLLRFLEFGDQPAALRVLEGKQRLEIAVVDDLPPASMLEIVPQRLEECEADLWILGIDAQGSLDGGVAAAVAAAAGEGYHGRLLAGLAETDRQPGALVFTEGFATGVRNLAHIVTVPPPSRDVLAQALQRALEFARREHAGTVALPALGCGRGGLRAEEVAGPLLDVLARWKERLYIIISAPREVDREPFLRGARQRKLLR